MATSLENIIDSDNQSIASKRLQKSNSFLNIPNYCLLDSTKSYLKHFNKVVIMQWYECSINYLKIQPYLNYCIDVYQQYHKQIVDESIEHVHLLKLPPNILKNIDKASMNILQLTNIGYKKFRAFVQFKKCQIIYNWKQLNDIMNQLSVIQIRTHQHCQQRHNIKQLIKILYKQIQCLKLFIEINQQTILHIKYIYQKYIIIYLNIQNIQNQKPILLNNLQSIPFTQFQQLQNDVKQLYNGLVYQDQKKKYRLENLITTHQQKKTKSKQYFLIGLFLGLGIVIIFIMIGLLISDWVDLNYDQNQIDSMVYIFPMFRGIGLLILYLWGHAWNVYGFNVYRINYRFILQYGSHYSTYFQIVKRAGFFTLIYILMLLGYFIGKQVSNSKHITISVEYTPFVVWVLFLGYIFFPSRQVFNPAGRKYFYRMLKKMIAAIWGNMNFLISWFTDQTVSFVVPIKDMAYTICFYTSDFQVQSVKQCLNSTHVQGVLVTYVVAIIPLILRMFQCYRQAILSSNKFLGHIQMWNFLKYTASLLTATISFISSYQSSLFYLFIGSSIFSTSYAYYWDLKYDWGFLDKNQKHKFLRKNLSYKNPIYYYIAIGINLIFRCSWTLTISASVTKVIPKSTFLPFLTGFLQILRRCMWNFIRIQKQHIANCTNFRITKDIDPIFKQIRLLEQRSNHIQPNRNLKMNSSLLSGLLQGQPFIYKKTDKIFKSSMLSSNITKTNVEQKKQLFLEIIDQQHQLLNDLDKDKTLKKYQKSIASYTENQSML